MFEIIFFTIPVAYLVACLVGTRVAMHGVALNLPFMRCAASVYPRRDLLRLGSSRRPLEYHGTSDRRRSPILPSVAWQRRVIGVLKRGTMGCTMGQSMFPA